MKLRLSGVAAAICVVGLSLGATPVLAAQKVNWNVSPVSYTHLRAHET